MRDELAIAGVDGMVVHDVTETADVALGTFYNHFDDKAAGLTTLAEIEATLVRHMAIEADGGPSDLARWASISATLLVQRAAADPKWIAAMRSLVDAQMWPTAAGTDFQIQHFGGPLGSDNEEFRWTIEVFQSVTRGLVRHLANHGFSGSVERRVERAVATMCGALLIEPAAAADIMAVCKAIPWRTEWPDATELMLDDDDEIAEQLRAADATASAAADV